MTTTPGEGPAPGEAARPTLLLAEGTRALADAGTSSPAAEARTLLAHVLGIGLGRLAVAGPASPEEAAAFRAMVARRAAGEPVQHITGAAHFRTVEVAVGPGVFVPRPETEAMVGFALDWLRTLSNTHEPTVVELCAGSGAISLALVTEHQARAWFHAVELSDEAGAWASRNLAGTGVDLRVGDMADAFAELDGMVDLVIANPPYIPLEAWESVAVDVRDHDPALALWSGDDGLDATRVVARTAARLLRGGGLVLSEHAEVQHLSAPAVFVDEGHFEQVHDHPDLTGRARFVSARRTGSRCASVAGTVLR